ncbi:hypothetical protein ACSV5G_02280 [Agrobacterium cavarae]|uniref:hypothetical protein n=1 Tax=Agrobacterium cavarae TaxID=2528239 RepID=UPI003FD25765
MAGPQRTYGFNETTSVIRPQPSESLNIFKLVSCGRCAAGRERLHPLRLSTIIAVEHDRSDLQRGVISSPP